MGLGPSAVMRCLLFICICMACNLLALPAVEKIDIKPVGYLRAGIYAPFAVAPDTTVSVTSHLTNISPAPVRLNIEKNTYQSFMLYVRELRKGVDPNKTTDVWGPAGGRYLKTDISNLLMSGVPEGKQVRHLQWPERDGIILFEREGYARKINFREGWLSDKELPKRGTDYLVLSVPVSMPAQLPVLEPDAVAPGKQIKFDEANTVYAPSARLLPFERRASDSKEEPEVVSESGPLQLSIELHGSVEAGRDLTAVYLIGNVGKQPVWIEQNKLVPAYVDWELRRNDHSLATITGEELQDLAVLLPQREPIPINPGEYLSWRRVFLASELPIKSRREFSLSAKIVVGYYKSKLNLEAAEVTDVQLQDEIEFKPD